MPDLTLKAVIGVAMAIGTADVGGEVVTVGMVIGVTAEPSTID
jgi:hypothetical protein